MREILFRGKAINRDIGWHNSNYKNGDWVYGLYTKKFDERFPNLPAEMQDVDGINGIEVDYNTIGQCTGLTDQNGKKIFEGDIVSCHSGAICNGVHEHSRTITVDFEDYISILEINECEECAIIGNIYDNPELLKWWGD